VLIFTSCGNAIKKKVSEIAECKWRDKGATLSSIEKTIALNETAVAFMKAGEVGSVLFMTKQGMVKKSELKELITTKSFYQVCKLSDGDEVLSVELDKKDSSILMLSRKGMSLNFDKNDIPTQGRISGGVKGMNLDENDSVIFASQIDFSHVIVVTENGYIKKINVKEFPISQRYRKGLKYVTFAKNCQNVNFVASATGEITLAVDFGLKVLPLETNKLPESERTASGNEIIKKNFMSIVKLI
jgi:topoisomerase-4 subunit A